MRSWLLLDAIAFLSVPWWIVVWFVFRGLLARKARPRTTGETLSFERKQVGL